MSDFTKEELIAIRNNLSWAYTREENNLLYSVYHKIQSMIDNYKKNKVQFTCKQIDHISYQIGEWYVMMKPLLEGQHNLGYMKEKLKNMICGDDF